MATHLGGMPPMYRVPTASSSPIASKEIAGPFGSKDRPVYANPVRGAPEAARKTVMDFLEQLGEPERQYGNLTGLTGD